MGAKHHTMVGDTCRLNFRSRSERNVCGDAISPRVFDEQERRRSRSDHKYSASVQTGLTDAIIAGGVAGTRAYYSSFLLSRWVVTPNARIKVLEIRTSRLRTKQKFSKNLTMGDTEKSANNLW